MNQRLIIFSHGMGVLKDNRGLFPFLANLLEPLGYATRMFDYNDIDAQSREVRVKSFSKQAEILQVHIDQAKAEEFAEINIIGQSQGSLIPALCDVSGIKRVVCISPFFHTSMDDVLKRYSKEGNVVDFQGTTRRKRSDGTTTVIPKEYWDERFATNVEDLYNKLAQSTELTLINALQDEIMNFTNLQKVKYARIINTEGDHDFSGEFQEILGKLIVRELT